jgi:hypothetical protein
MGRIKSLPTFEQLERAYPNGLPKKVVEQIGGKVQFNYEDPKQLSYKDTCVIRISRSLNYSNHPIIKKAGVRVNSGSDKKWYVYSVHDMKKYLELTYGPPDIKKTGKRGSITPAMLKEEANRGIILFTGVHIDLWNGSECVYHSTFAEVSEVLIWKTPNKKTGK